MDEPTIEIVRLWSAVYGEPPVVLADIRTMIDVLVAGLPEPPPSTEAEAVG